MTFRSWKSTILCACVVRGSFPPGMYNSSALGRVQAVQNYPLITEIKQVKVHVIIHRLYR